MDDKPPHPFMPEHPAGKWSSSVPDDARAILHDVEAQHLQPSAGV